MISFYPQPGQLAATPITDALTNQMNASNSVLPYLSMLRIFVAQIATPDLSPEERMQAWVVLMRFLNDPITP